MPELTDSTRARRVEQALEVYRLLATDGKITQKKACEQVGIDPQTYRYWISQSGEAIEVFHKALAEVERSELALILSSREQITGMLIKDALSKFTEPGVRLSIKQYLDAHSERMQERHRGLDNDSARKLLSGCELEPGESRFPDGRNIVDVDAQVVQERDGTITVSLRNRSD